MRKILSLLLIIVLLLCVGCSKQTSNNSSIANISTVNLDVENSSVENNSQSNDDYDDSMEANNNKKPPNEKFIINDLKKNDINAFELNYCYERLDVDSLEIIKRKTEDDMDTVYVSVVFKNTAYTVNVDITLYYSFYTVGGWILDYHEITYYESFANQPYYTDDKFIQLLLENFDSGKIISRDHGINDNGNYYDNISFSGILKYNYLTTTITGTYSMIFANDVWTENIVLNSVSNDWSKMIGTWQYTHENGDYIIFEIKNMSDINEEECSMSYTYSTSQWKWLDKIYGNSFKDYTDTQTRNFYYEEKKYVLGCEIKIPKDFSLMANLGGDFMRGAIYIDKNDGGMLKAIEDLNTDIYYSCDPKTHSFILTKNK